MARPKKDKPDFQGKLYRYRITVDHKFDGTPIRKAFYSSKSKADARQKAEQYLAKKQLEIKFGEILEPEKATFKTVCDTYLNNVKATLSAKTFDCYSIIIRVQLLPYFGNAIISTIKPLDVQSFFNSISNKSPLDSMRKYKAVLNLIFKFAENNGLCAKNPCNNIKLKSNVEKKKKSVYTPEQAEQVLEFARSRQNIRTGIAIELMLGYGLRKGEVLGLHTGNIDFDNNTINIVQAAGEAKDIDGVHRTLILPPKNESSRRTIPISKDLIERIRSLGSGYIIRNENGSYQNPSNWTKRDYKRFMQQLNAETGLPILSPHELRHTRATIWVNEGKNLFAVAAILGHSDLKMLQERYAHKDIDALRKNLDI